jgi:hypothetical protein
MVQLGMFIHKNFTINWANTFQKIKKVFSSKSVLLNDPLKQHDSFKSNNFNICCYPQPADKFLIMFNLFSKVKVFLLIKITQNWLFNLDGSAIQKWCAILQSELNLSYYLLKSFANENEWTVGIYFIVMRKGQRTILF